MQNTFFKMDTYIATLLRNLSYILKDNKVIFLSFILLIPVYSFSQSINTLRPTVSISEPSRAFVNSTGTVEYTVTYENVTEITLSSTDIMRVVVVPGVAFLGGGVGVTVSGAPGPGELFSFTRTVSLTGFTGNGLIAIEIFGGTARNVNAALGLHFAPLTPRSIPFTVDNTRPRVMISNPTISGGRSAANSDATVTYTITYTDTTDPDDMITLNAFADVNNILVLPAGVTSADIEVTQNDNIRTVTITNAEGDGNVRITIPAGTSMDRAGNMDAGSGNAIVPMPVSSATFEVDNTAPTNQDAVFTTSVPKKGGATVTIASSGAANNEVWFAPAGTTSFTAGNTKTKATSGTTTSILAPTMAGAYRIYVIDRAGNRSTPSSATLTVDNSAPTSQNTVFPMSMCKKGGTDVTIGIAGGSMNNNQVWFAPTGTTTFAANVTTITTASGRTTSILAPTAEGTYKIYVIDRVGNVSAPSTATLFVDNSAPTSQNTVFPTSVTQESGTAVTIVSSGNANNEVWFAPAGTTSFTAGNTMTKATSGTAISILAPANEGTYRIYVIDCAGNVSDPSSAILTVDDTQIITVAALNIRRVTVNGAGNRSGNSWANASQLQAALAASTTPGNQVWIAAGTYKPHADDRTATFSVPVGVLVYGGFAGTENDNFDPATNDTRPRNAEGVLTNVTILSGDLAADDGTRPVRPPATDDQTAYDAALAVYAATRNDNSNTVVTITGSNVILDGLTITAGEGEGGTLVGEGNYFGAGLYAGAGTTGTTLTGCTFTNNEVDDEFGVGGGAYFNGTATLTGCTFTGNEVGGGAYFVGTATLTACIFTGNVGGEGIGGGAHFSGTATLMGCTFIDNEGGSGGATFGGTATLTGCTFIDNEGGSGGATFGGTATLTGCTFIDNEGGSGGAIFREIATLTGCTFTDNEGDIGGAYFEEVATLTGCTFTGNEGEFGGGAYFEEVATLTNCVLVGNSANVGGGLVFYTGGMVINSTFYNNTATEQGGGIAVFYYDDTDFNLQNSIFVGNTATIAGNAIYLADDKAPLSATDIEAVMDYNLIGGGMADLGVGLYDEDADTYTAVPFADATNVTFSNTIEESDATVVFASTDAMNANYLRLKAGSPAVGAGNNDYLNNGTPANTEDDIKTDAAGNARIQGGRVDLGAYESGMAPPAALNIRRVTTTGAGNGDGSSWANASQLQAALAASTTAGNQVWIAAGTYKPHADDQTATFSVPVGVLVYGGFAGTENDNFDPATNDTRPRNAEGVLTNVTILSGDLAADDGTRPVRPPATDDQTAYNAARAVYDATRDDNSNTVVTITGSNATLDGLTITAGEGGTLVGEDFGEGNYFGAGLYAGAGTAGTTLTGCTFTGNERSFNGGGAYFNGSATLTACTFTGNEGSGGGALFDGIATLTGCTFTGNDGSGANFFGTATLMACTFTGNVGGEESGGGANFSGTATLTGCTFTDNEGEFGAGAFAEATLTGCTFTGNRGELSGGAYFNETATLTGCTFTDNEGEFGGGAYFEEVVTLTNCVLVGNSATEAGGILVTEGGTVINSTFYNNTATERGGGIGIGYYDTDFNLQNSILVGNTATIAGNAIYLVDVEAPLSAADIEVVMDHNLIGGGMADLGVGLYDNDADTYTDVPFADATSVTLTNTIEESDATAVFASIVAANPNYLRLAAISPAVGAGNNDYLNNGTPANTEDDIKTDAAGNTRIQSGTVDLGAYESAFAAPTPQIIDFTLATTGTVGDKIDLTATADSGLEVTFTSSDETVAAIGTGADAGKLVLLTVGMTTITASQDGDDTYAAATDVTQTITVEAAGTQTPNTHTGNIAVTSQAQVDALRTTLAGVTRIDGRVRIGFNTGDASNITDLSPFENITEITGILNIEVNPLLTNLMGLNQLQSIRGSFGVINNAGLTSLGDLSALTMIGNNFEVDNNDNLTSLGNFPALTTISNHFVVRDNNLLTSLGDLSALTMIGNNFVVDSNDKLISLGDLNALESIGDRFRVSGNDKLISLGSFSMLTSIGTDIRIEDNDLLQGCCVLTEFLSGAAYAVSGSVTINNNAEGCNTPGQVNCDAFLRIAQGGEVSAAATATESTLDIFSTLRWQLSKPDTGAEWITSIADGSTSGVTSITGANDAFITITTTANTSNRDRSTVLTLRAINTAGTALTDPPPVSIFFTQRNDKTYIGNVTVRNQNEVEALRMLFTAEITRIEGNLTIGPESGMSDITDLSPLVAITEITGDVLIHRNADLQNLTGLNQLQSIGGSFEVGGRTGTRGNPSLTSLGDFSVLQSIDGSFEVFSNGLTSMGDFRALTTIDGDFLVLSNNNLLSLGDFSALQSIGGDFGVGGPVLTSLGDLSALATIGGSFEVRGTALTSSLGDFPVLTTIGSHFEVRNNAALLSLGSFPLLTSIGSSDRVFVPSAGMQDNVSILVENNGRLQGCCVLTPFFRGEANGVSGLVFINDNAPGCSSIMQVNCDPFLQVGQKVVFVAKTATEGTLEIFSTLRWQLSKPNTGAEWITNIAADGGNSDASSIIGKDYRTITLTTTANPTDAGRSTTLTLRAIDETDSPLPDPPPVTIPFTQLGIAHIGDVFVTTQAEVNALTLTANATTIQGNVTIGPASGTSDINDLSPFAAITEITGNVFVRNNPDLPNLVGLNQLQTIGGFFSVLDNATLTSLGNFPALQSIGGGFFVSFNDLLTSLGNFSTLETIGGSFYMRNNDDLTSLGAFPMLASIGSSDGIYIPSTDSRQDGVSIVVENNDRLQDCCVLTEFLSGAANAVSGQVFIGNNAQGCSSTTQVNCDPFLQVGQKVVFVAKTATEGTLEIFSTLRWQLSKPDTGADWITNIAADGGNNDASSITGENDASIAITTTVNPNDVGRSTTLTLTAIDIAGNALTDPDPVTIPFTQLGIAHIGDVFVTTQAEINALTFPANAMTIQGNVTIGPASGTSDITDLSPFAAITEITGNVVVQRNPDLQNLVGLNQLQTIGGFFDVFSNASLTSLGDFSTLQSIGDYFYVSNEALTFLGDFTALQTIGSFFNVRDNAVLTSLGDFSTLQSIGSSFSVSSTALTSLGDFPVLQSIGSFFQVFSNDDLTSLGDFSALQTIGDNFYVSNDDLISLGDFSTLQSIGGSFGVENNADLTSLGNFPDLQAIEGSFVVKNNDLLTSLEGFPALQAISGHFEVSGNVVLTSLEGFPILTDIGSADGVAVLGTGTNEDGVSILVEGNDLLQDCCLLIAFLSGGTNAVSGQILIGDNASGCDSNTEISTCETQTITFTSDDTGTIGTPITLMATAQDAMGMNTGLPVTFEITGEFEADGTTPATAGTVATLDAGVLTLVGVGVLEITATQAGGTAGGITYAPATQTQTLTVEVAPTAQTLTFTSPDNGAVGETITLVATSSSGLAVTFEITGEFEADGTTPVAEGTVATLADDGTTLSLTGVGTVEVTATQAGNATYAETTKTQTITVRDPAIPAIFRVTLTGDATADGSTWPDVMTLQAALASTLVANDQIWIQAGTYKPVTPAGATATAEERAMTFTIPAGVLVYGGFAGNEPDDFDLTTDRTGGETILSGDLLGGDPARTEANYEAMRNDNSLSVVTIGGNGVTLNGLTIQGGQGGADVPEPMGPITFKHGAGLYSAFSNTTLVSCTFRSNDVTAVGIGRGGGAHFNGAATLTSCTFTDNRAEEDGGAIYTEGSFTITLTDCTFTNNTASKTGGAVNLSSPSILTNCTFTGNRATFSGGAATLSATTLTGCVFTGNRSFTSGGAVTFANTATLTNCVVAGNTANSNGGGVWFTRGATVINSTFYNNTAGANGGGMYMSDHANSVTLQNNLLVGNSAVTGDQVFVVNTNTARAITLQHNLVTGGANPMGTGQGVVYQNTPSASVTEAGTVTAADAGTVFVSIMASDDNYLRLKAGSPAANAGNNDYVNNATPPITTDLAGAMRIQGGTVDLGAYESAFAAPTPQTLVFTLTGDLISGNTIPLTTTSQDTDGTDITAGGLPAITYMSSDENVAEVRAVSGGGQELVLKAPGLVGDHHRLPGRRHRRRRYLCSRYPCYTRHHRGGGSTDACVYACWYRHLGQYDSPDSHLTRWRRD